MRNYGSMKRCVGMLAPIACGLSTLAHSTAPFQFEQFPSLEYMREFVAKEFALGASRESVRAVFVHQGRATLKLNPNLSGSEKYLYDINLCGYYLWRWNISADFDEQAHLRQAYVNGEPVFKEGTPIRDFKDLPSRGGKSAIVRVTIPRAAASKGESTLTATVFDKDGDMKTTDDQMVQVVGPTRAELLDRGNVHVYAVERWRSIGDGENPDTISNAAGDCAAVDAYAEKLKQMQKIDPHLPAK